MSEQIKQSNEFSKPIYIGEWRVYDIGATTLGDLIKNNIINKHTDNPDVLKKKPDALIVDTNKEIVLYCQSGERSLQAYKKLIKLQYKNVYNLYRGIDNWL